MVEVMDAGVLDEQLELRQVRFAQVIEDILKVLRADLETYVLREAKQAYLNAPIRAEEVEKEELKAYRIKAAKLASEAAEEAVKALASTERWLPPEGPPSDPRSLEGVQGVSSALGGVQARLSVLLQEFKFAEEAPAYRYPAYFVAGFYLPTLAEHYWRIVTEIRELEAKKAELALNATRDLLEARWDEAGE